MGLGVQSNAPSRVEASLMRLDLARADDGDRTRDPQLGKLMLYQLSYFRLYLNGKIIVLAFEFQIPADHYHCKMT